MYVIAPFFSRTRKYAQDFAGAQRIYKTWE